MSVETSRGPSQSRLENYRRDIPRAVEGITQLLVDNPAQMLLLVSGTYVLTNAIVNLAKPRGLFGILACGIVSSALASAGAAELVRRDIITIRVRDEPAD